MLDPQRVTALAEAIADGVSPDWESAESDSVDRDERETIAKLRAVASVGHLFAQLSAGSRHPKLRLKLHAGAVWGGLRVIQHVGSGRFGDVYRAWDPALARHVALKLVHLRDGDDGLETQVVEEGRLMARVRHPNVVTIHGAQRLDGVTGLWMEYIDGRTLAAELAEQGPFPAAELTRVGIELCHALAAVHEAGLVHRDVKAQNVMRDARGRVVLGDFGTGREFDENVDSRTGLSGTPAYLAPEIFERQPASKQSDLYSLGALLFHLATRAYPVQGGSLRDLRDAHAEGRRVTLRSLRPDLPARLVAVIDKALARDPAQRYPTAAAMGRALERCLPRATTRRRAVIAASAVAAAALAAIVAIGVLRPWRASGPVLPFEARDWVLVTAFDNRTGDPVLDGPLEYAIARELANSTFVKVVSRTRVADTLQLMLKPADTPVDVEIGREVALRDGQIRALVAGRVEKVGEAYALSADILGAGDGRVVASISEASAIRSDLLTAAGRLALEVRRRLGESLASVGEQGSALPKVTTSSLRALQLYAKAAAMAEAPGWGGQAAAAETLLREALAEDPGFASAHRLLSIAVRSQGGHRLPEAMEHIERAAAASDRASPAERLVNEAEVHLTRRFVQGAGYGSRVFTAEEDQALQAMVGRAIASFDGALRIDPDHLHALTGLAECYRLLGTPNARVNRRLADLRPTSAFWQVAAAVAILNDNPADMASARHYVQRAQRLPPGGADAFSAARARLFDADEAWLRSDPREALRVADQVAAEMRALPPQAASQYAAALWRTYTTLGQLARAREVAALAPAARNALLIVEVFSEDRQRIAHVLKEHFPRADWLGLSSALVEAGLLAEARAAVAAMKQRPAVTLTEGGAPGNFAEYVTHVEGQLAVAEHRSDAAIALLHDFVRESNVHRSTSRWLRATRALAKAWAQKGDLTRAVSLLESASPRPVEVVVRQHDFGPEWLQIRDLLAQLYRKAGRSRDADAVESELLALLAVADDDHPIKRRLLKQVANGATNAPSPRAQQLYALALDALRGDAARVNPAAAEQLVRQALLEEPGFASARILLAELTPADERASHVDRALADATQATDAERLDITGRAYYLRGMQASDPAARQRWFEQAIGALEALQQLQMPSDSANSLLVRLYRRTDRAAEAIALQRRLADAQPTTLEKQVAAAQGLLEVGDVAGAQQYIRRARASKADSAAVPVWLPFYDAHEAWLRGDVREALRLADAAAADTAALSGVQRHEATVHAFSLYVTLGRLRQAERIVTRFPDLQEQPFFVANVLSQRDDREALRAFLLQHFNGPAARRVGSLWLEVGELDIARRAIADSPLLYYHGQLALAEGRIAEAIRLLELSLTRDRVVGDPNRSRVARKLAQAFRAAGDLPRAVEALERDFRDRASRIAGAASGYDWLKSADALADLYRVDGRVTDAERVEAEIRKLLAVADEDHPIARRMRSREAVMSLP
jgi:tetratricopeptide (TPR) repeat protein